MNFKEFSEVLYGDIQSGVYDETGKLFPEDQLIKKYGVTRYCLRNAVSLLVERGVIYQVQGSGTYLRPQAREDSMSLADTRGITAEFKEKGKQVQTTVISFEEIKAKDISLAMDRAVEIEPEDDLYCVKRLRSVEGQPFVVEFSYYMKSMVPYLNREVAENSIYEYIHTGLSLSTGFADKIIKCEKLPEDVAGHLGLAVNDPALIIEDEVYSSSGKLFNFSKLYYHFEHAKFFMLADMK